MFSKSNPLTPSASPTPTQGGFGQSVLAPDLLIKGDVVSTSTVEVLGRVEGNITAHTVILGAEGQVTGKLSGETVDLRGKFGGTIAAKSLALRSSCDVQAEVACATLSIESGAVVEGQFKVTPL